ncbi:hypothetical protein POPTR_017G045266v4 [Populus trichocarpa]|uniref:Uncharacterized protein n=1 Tax=Populus trichocarpa TaxID=3694 RepID=A0ACC0RPA0_POPTR|nr:hypothetical protein POPTR_017G045266v4 [Populus trichocarpa]
MKILLICLFLIFVFSCPDFYSVVSYSSPCFENQPPLLKPPGPGLWQAQQALASIGAKSSLNSFRIEGART